MSVASRAATVRSGRRLRLDRAPIAALALAAAAVVVAAVLTHYAFRAWNHTFDEDIYRNLGLWTSEHLPRGIWHLDPNVSDRGVQRLEGWVIAIGLGGFGSPDGFKITKVLNIVAFCSTVIPIYWWALRLEIPKALAAVAAALAILVPWACITTTFFTENVAYPTAAWALFAIWSAAVRPGARTLLLAVLAVALAATGRSVLILLAAGLVVTLVAVALRFHARSAWAARATWTPRQVAPWAALALAVVVGLAIYAVDRSALSPITGVYSTNLGITWSLAPDIGRRVLANLVSGTGILPGIVAAAWVAKALWKPARPHDFALAVIVVGTAALMIYSALRGGADERYTMFLAPVLILAAANAVARRAVGPLALAISTGLVIWLFASVTWTQDSQAYGFFINSAEAFHGRILLLNIPSHLPTTLGLSPGALLAVGILVAMALVAVAVRRRGREAMALGVVLVAGLVGLQLAQLTYVTKQFTAQAAFGGPSLSAHTWVDNIMGDREAAFFNVREGDGVLREAWREVAFWNLSIKRVYLSQVSADLPGYTNPVEPAHISMDTGMVTATPPLPSAVLQTTRTVTAPLVGKTIATTYEPIALLQISQPARVKWFVSTTDDAGFTQGAAPAKVRVFSAGGTGDCLWMDLEGPQGQPGWRTTVVRSGSDVKRIRVKEYKPRRMENIPLHRETAGHFQDIVVQPEGHNVGSDGADRGVHVANIGRMTCTR